MASPMLAALLEEESASRRANLTPRPFPAGNPVMEQMGGGGGFQITPEELAFEPKGSRGKAFGTAALSTLFGGARQAIPAYQASMGRQENRQIEEAYRGASQRFLEKENRTRQDFNELAQFRAQLTGEQPRLYAPPNLQTTLRNRAFTDKKGVERFQPELVSWNPETGQMVGEPQPYGDPVRQRARRRSAPLTKAEFAAYRNKRSDRAMIAEGKWQDEIRDIIEVIDPDREIDINDENAGIAALFGSKGSDRLPNYIVDRLKRITGAFDYVPGDEGLDDATRNKMKLAFEQEVFDIWRQHKYGDGATTTDPNLAGDMDARLKGLGAGPAGATTQDPSLLSQARAAFGGGGDPYARQPASIGPPTNVLRSAQAPERLQPITTPRVSGAPFEGARQLRENVLDPIGAGVGRVGAGIEAGVGRAGTRAARALEPIGRGVAEAFDPLSKALAEWQGPGRANAALRREMETAGRGPMPLSRLGGDLISAAAPMDRAYSAAPAFDPFASRDVGPAARRTGEATPVASVSTPNIMAGIRGQLTDLDLAVERAREEEPEERRKPSRKKKRKKKESELQEILREIVEGGPTRRASVSTPNVMAEIREQLKQLDLAVR